MTPAGSAKRKSFGNGTRVEIVRRHDESRAVEMCPRKQTANLQLLPDDERRFLADDLQPDDATGDASTQRLQTANGPHVVIQCGGYPVAEFVLRERCLPAIEIPRLSIRGRQNLGPQRRVGEGAVGGRVSLDPRPGVIFMAQRQRVGRRPLLAVELSAPKVGNISILPGRGEGFGHPPAALGKSCVGDLTLVGENEATGCLDGFPDGGGVSGVNPTIPLTVVIGAHVKVIVNFSVGPADDLPHRATGRRNRRAPGGWARFGLPLGGLRFTGDSSQPNLALRENPAP